MFRLQQALKPAKEDSNRSGQHRPVNAEELEQMKILQEQEGYQQDWANKNASKINYSQALHFFNDFFQEQEDEEMRQKRA